jgi:ArsR family transcriptional regulator, arsenate/arsenite/antimonite-responsive transcriptional repressor
MLIGWCMGDARTDHGSSVAKRAIKIRNKKRIKRSLLDIPSSKLIWLEAFRCVSFIVYRRLTMNDVQPLDRQTADTYAAWFKALADGTRVQVVSLLARAGRPLTVKEIVAAVPVGQSTVSEHLRQLAAVGFVLAAERGTSRLYRINGNCVTCFPTAADLVMGKPSPVPSAIPAA